MFIVHKHLARIMASGVYVTLLLVAAVLAGGKADVFPDRKTCGYDKLTEDRIVGGQATEIGEFPWLAAIEYQSKWSDRSAGILCGGSLISSRVVLTAAHCIVISGYKVDKVWLGDWDISQDPDCTTIVANTECADPVVKVKVVEAIAHPGYHGIDDNDIGVLILDRDVEFTDYIVPICLPINGIPEVKAGITMVTAGWGATDNSTESDVKLKVSVPLVENSVCNDKLHDEITEHQLCAGGESGKDSCYGDSGGPLMRAYKEDPEGHPQWVADGVVSWGEGCGSPGKPGVYTNTVKYIDWIKETIEKKLKEYPAKN